MLGTILAFLTALGPSALHLGDQITQYKIQKNNTESQREKNKIDQQIAETNARRDVVVAEAGNRIAVIFKGIARTSIIAGPISYILKISLVDKVIGSFVGCAGKFATPEKCWMFVTDPLNLNLDTVTASILAAACAFYLMYDIASISRRK